MPRPPDAWTALLVVVLLALFGAIALVGAQQNVASSPQTATLDQLIPVDPQITVVQKSSARQVEEPAVSG